MNGTNNTFGIDSAAWNSIRTAEKLAVGRQYAAEHGWEPISPLNTPMYYGYIDGGYYDDYGNLLEVSGGGSAMGVGTGGMNSVGAPNSGGGAGSVGSGYGYAQPGAGLSPINSGGFGGAGQGIYDDASMYRGGDFWGGGSDPYAGTQYAGGGGGGGFDPMRGGYVTADAPARGSAEWYGAGYDMIPDGDYSSARDFTGGAGYGGYGGGGGGGSPAYDAGPSYWGGNNYPDIQGQAPPQSPSQAPSSAGPSWWGGNNYPDIRAMTPEQWYGAGYDMIPGASYGDYGSGRDFTGGASYGGGGGGGGQSPAFDYNAMNMPSFDGNWGDAAFLAQPGGVAPGLYGSGDYSSARDFRGMTSEQFYGAGYDMIPGATRDRIAQLLGQDADPLNIYAGGESSHAETPRAPDTKMQVGPENYPPTPWGGGFDMRPPTYNNRNEFTQPGTGQYLPPGEQPWAFPGYTPPGSRVPFTDPNWTGWGDQGGA